ncbi:MAG: lytic transglycosylase domain-containing protein [Acidobacteria bacterium]|nr:lytic transglycosylase domain-containing protein [Acidobacteriota bacterium]
MRNCFHLLVCAVLASAALRAAGPAHRVTSVVRADVRSGRLIRAIVVPARVVSSVAAEQSGAQAGSNALVAEGAIGEVVEQTARKYDLDPLLVHSVIQVESNYNPYAISHKGAEGLMQLIPGTARRFGVRNSFDIRQNIEGGVRYLKYLSGLFPNDLRLALAAYNAGEAAVTKYGNSIPPYPETEQYVYKVGKRYGSLTRASGPARTTTPAEPAKPAAPEHRPVLSYLDAEGRLHLRTADTPPAAAP